MASNVMELFAKIGLDQKEFDSGLDSAKGKLSSFGSALGSVGTTALKVTGAAIAGAATGVIALTKSAYSAYSEYQQLSGGIETLFKDSSDQMMEYAEKAYKTAGISKNEYMNIAIESSAAMINSLGGDTEKAAELTDMAIRDMSDNMNKMGTSMESLQNAYRGFSRGNFTMLDNLSLGFSGTKEGMQQLLDKAHELSGIEYDIESYADIVQAINVVQTEMGITGTTALEAADTISGSFGSLKAAWENLVTGFADPDADLGALISDVVQTGSQAIKNAIPTIANALKGIGQAVAEIAPILAEELPSLLEAATSLVNTLSAALPDILDVLVQQIPAVLPSLLQAASNLLSAVAGQLPTLISIVSDVLIQEIPKLMTQIQKNIGKITAGLTKILKSVGDLILKLTPVIFPILIDVAVELIKSLTQGFAENASEVINGIFAIFNVIVETLSDPEMLMTVLECGIQILTALVNGIAENLPLLLETCGTLITNIATFLLEAIPELVVAIGKNGATIVTDVLPQILTSIGQAGAELLLKVSSILSGWIPDIVSGAKDAFESIGKGVVDAWEWIKEKLGELGTKALQHLMATFSLIYDIGKNLVQGLWNGINDAKDWVLEKIKGFGTGILDGIKDFFGISSPSKKTAVFGRYLAEGLAVGVEDEAPDAFKDIQSALDKGMDSLEMDPLNLDTMAHIGVQSNGASAYDSQTNMLTSLAAMMMQLLNKDERIVIPVYLGNKPIDEMIVDVKNRLAVRSGGQVNA